MHVADRGIVVLLAVDAVAGDVHLVVRLAGGHALLQRRPHVRRDVGVAVDGGGGGAGIGVAAGMVPRAAWLNGGGDGSGEQYGHVGL